MKALALSILLAMACSGGKPKDTTASGGSGSAIYAKKIVVSFGITPAGATSEVFLQTTDETGKQVSYPVGTYDGECKVIQPVEAMKALTGVSCTGIELHAVVNDADIVVLKMKVDGATTPDPMAREEVTRVKAPSGAAISAA